jgi:hypothetical protein
MAGHDKAADKYENEILCEKPPECFGPSDIFAHVSTQPKAHWVQDQRA